MQAVLFEYDSEAGKNDRKQNLMMVYPSFRRVQIASGDVP